MRLHWTAILAVNFMCTGLFAQHKYAVKKSFPVYGMGKWDYLTLGPDDHLYVSNFSQVNVLDKNTGDSLGVIKGTAGVHGVAFVPKTGKGYTSNGAANTVSVFDLKTFKVLNTIKAGENPDAIFYEPWSKKLITSNGKSQDLSLIDPVTEKVVATIALAGKPETAVSNQKGMLYVNLEDKNEILAIDLHTNTVKARWSLAPAEAPTGLVYDAKTNRLYAGCEESFIALDASTGKVVSRLPIGASCDGVTFNPKTREIFTSNGEGTMNVIKAGGPDSYQVLDKVPTQLNGKTITIDPKTGHLYISVATYGPAVEKGVRPPVIANSFKVMDIY